MALALISAIMLVFFSKRQAAKQEREAKERGTFIRSLQMKELLDDEGLETPLPVLR